MTPIFYGISVVVILLITYNMYLLDQTIDTWVNTTHNFIITFKSFKLNVAKTKRDNTLVSTDIYPFMLFGSTSITNSDGSKSTMSYDMSNDVVTFSKSVDGNETERTVTLRKSDLD